MTEMSPLRPATETEAEASASMIERAMARLGPGGFSAPPVPTHLMPTDLLPANLLPAKLGPPIPPALAPAAPAARLEPPASPSPSVAAPALEPASPRVTSPDKPSAAPLAAPAPHETPGKVHIIERDRLVNAGIAHPDGGGTAQLEEFRIVKRQLLENAAELARRGGGEAARRVLLTSPHSGEGKTFCAINLALSFAAERDFEVLLVDFDLARASVMAMFGLPASVGLMDALVDPEIDVADCILATDVPGLSVLPGGPPTHSDAEYLASAHARTVLDRLTANRPNRLVLFDTPPALAASIPGALAKLVGQVVLVVKADTTAQGAVKDAANLLGGCPNLHLLLNAARFSPSGRRFGSYYGYRG